MVTTSTESGWQGTQSYIPYLAEIWSDNRKLLAQINESRDVPLVLKSLSDYYYGLMQLKQSIIFFIESDQEANDKINAYFEEIKAITQDREIIQCPLDWNEIYKVRNTLLKINEELFRVQGRSKLLTPINVRKKYETLGEELDEENA